MKGMKEISDFYKELNSIEEGRQVIDPVEFGSQRNLQDNDVYTGLSYLEQGMGEIVGDVAVHNLSISKAQKEVDKAIKQLVKDEVLPEPPTEEATDGQKAIWLSNAKPKIKAHLQLNGIIL